MTEKLNAKPGMLSLFVDTVVLILGGTFPELSKDPTMVKDIIDEEQQFLKTQQGVPLVGVHICKTWKRKGSAWQHCMMSNHWATHVLNFALRKVLGKTGQEGSLVVPNHLWIDFSNKAAMTRKEIRGRIHFKLHYLININENQIPSR